MKQVIRYECPYCKKLFKTPDRHEICKFDPKHKNCFSCKHLERFEEECYYHEHERSVSPVCPYNRREEMYENVIDYMYHNNPK